MKEQIKRARWLLLLIPGPLAEILSTNIPIVKFLTPPNFILVTLAYGLPVLLIREIAVMRKLNALGIVLLGLCYGFLNEGVLAKTLNQPAGEPVGAFALYGQVGPFETGWAIFILFWHALHSVLYPILISRWVYPQAADERWFGRRGVIGLAVAIALSYTIYFLNPERRDPGTFLVIAVMTAVFPVVALKFCVARGGKGKPKGPWLLRHPAIFGGIAPLYYIFQYAAPHHIPFAAYAAICVALISGVTWLMAKSNWRPVPELLLFALGHDLVLSAVTGTANVLTHRSPLQTGPAAVAFVALFAWLIRRVSQTPDGRLKTKSRVS